jgi:uncharacterized membrane protein YqaE (UPF0057 family)
MYKTFEWITEAWGWLQIVASPFLIGLSLGTVVYLANPNATTLLLSILLTVLGLIIGIVWATRVWRKTGTIWFLSRIMATPELDDPEEVKKMMANPKGEKIIPKHDKQV